MTKWDPYAPMPGRRGAGIWPFATAFAFAAMAVVLWFRPASVLHDASAAPRAITPRADLASFEKTTIEIFRAISPSVVYISTQVEGAAGLSFDPTRIERGTGTGFVWDERGFIVTNYHVIREGNVYAVTLPSGEVLDARVVGIWEFDDIAVLKVEPPNGRALPAIPIGSSEDLVVGQSVFAIGNPFGLDSTLATGVISGLGRSIESIGRTRIEGVIQTDAAINPGNSGGPLLDSAGRLIGIDTAIYSPSGASAGIGFAVPVDRVNAIVPEIIRSGRISLPGLGIGLLPSAWSSRIVGGEGGLLFRSVDPASPASQAGLAPTILHGTRVSRLGDIIRAVDGQPVADEVDLRSILVRKRVGDTVTLTVERDGRRREVQVPLIDIRGQR